MTTSTTDPRRAARQASRAARRLARATAHGEPPARIAREAHRLAAATTAAAIALGAVITGCSVPHAAPETRAQVIAADGRACSAFPPAGDLWTAVAHAGTWQAAAPRTDPGMRADLARLSAALRTRQGITIRPGLAASAWRAVWADCHPDA